MLLKFKVKNYKSFVDDALFAMLPYPDEKAFEYSIMSEECGNETINCLPASVIYGPNASGKTNIIGAMETMREIIKRGNIRNAEYVSTPNQAAYKLELIPNCRAKKKTPCEFEIEFCEQGYKINYAISLDLGAFLDMHHARKILCEMLSVNNSMVFGRKGKKTVIYDLSPIAGHLPVSKQNELKNSNVPTADDEELFLENGFRINYAPEFVKIINTWLTEKFDVLPSVDKMNTTMAAAGNDLYVDKYANKAAKLFGLCSDEIGFYNQGNNQKPKMYSVYQKNKKSEIYIPADIFESYGTIRLVNIFPVLGTVLAKGATLVLDEFDASLHPMAIMSIISAFHNDNINKNHAQLIFNTHNPVFLNANIFRKDEIKFVEKNEKGNSEIYSLADFTTPEEEKSHKASDYMENYFVNRYGAIDDIDFSPLFEEIVKASAKRGEANA